MKSDQVWPASWIALLLVLLASSSSPAQDLLVSSRFSNNVLRYDGSTGAFKEVFASAEGLQNAIGMDWGPDGNLYVASGQNPEVYRFDGGTGQFLDLFVSDDPETTADETGGLRRPRGMTFGPDGNLYVASGGNDRVCAYDGDTGTFLRTAASGGRLDGPIGVAFDAAGVLYVAGGLTGKIHKYDPATGEFLGIFASTPTENATGIFITPAGSVFVGSGASNSVYKYSADGRTSVVFASGHGLTSVIGMAWRDGLLYVSSFDGDSVLRFDGTGEFVDEFVASGSGGLDGTHFFLFLEPTVRSERKSLGQIKRGFGP